MNVAGRAGHVHFAPGTSQQTSRCTAGHDVFEAGAALLPRRGNRIFSSGGDWSRPKGRFHSFISGKDLTNVTITGPGRLTALVRSGGRKPKKPGQKVSGFTLAAPESDCFNRCNNVRLAASNWSTQPKFHLSGLRECCG